VHYRVRRINAVRSKLSRAAPLPADYNHVLLLQAMSLPEASTWHAVEQWLRQGGPGEEVLLVFENTEDVLCHVLCAQVSSKRCAVLCCAERAPCVLCCAALCCALLRQQPPQAITAGPL
jgi:hypothetical protein